MQLGFFVNFEFGKQKKIQNVDLKYHATLKIYSKVLDFFAIAINTTYF